MTNDTNNAASNQHEPWRDEGGHAWEHRLNVECVECPHCCFIFAAVHTDGNSKGYSCPNCEGCPESSCVSDGEGAATVNAMWEAIKSECCKSPKAKLAIFVSEQKFKAAMARFAVTPSPAAAKEEG